jgi:hypothetical protein
VNAEKGFDGLPCTDDDPPATRGIAQTIPASTTLSHSMVWDADPSQNQPGRHLVHLRDSTGGGCGTGGCIAALFGAPFSCTALFASPPSVSGARLAATFPALDQQTGDAVVPTFLSAR